MIVSMLAFGAAFALLMWLQRKGNRTAWRAGYWTGRKDELFLTSLVILGYEKGTEITVEDREQIVSQQAIQCGAAMGKTELTEWDGIDRIALVLSHNEYGDGSRT